ncbi:uncharacterized protein JCM10292_003264 [Rhodotorula paludigena]|uniref:uncharacterized protein n=1 Tax=Rhodotorula paludigena TaxID=86838 RepID=UPI00316E2B3B
MPPSLPSNHEFVERWNRSAREFWWLVAGYHPDHRFTGRSGGTTVLDDQDPPQVSKDQVQFSAHSDHGIPLFTVPGYALKVTYLRGEKTGRGRDAEYDVASPHQVYLPHTRSTVEWTGRKQLNVAFPRFFQRQSNPDVVHRSSLVTGTTLNNIAVKGFQVEAGGWTFQQVGAGQLPADPTQSDIYYGMPNQPDKTLWHVTTDKGATFFVEAFVPRR